MPELPEVETVRRGLEPAMVGRAFKRVEARRPDLRFDLPKNFANRLSGATVKNLCRRGKYLVAELSTKESLIMHLGMSGRFSVESRGDRKAQDAPASAPDPKHDHVIFEFNGRPSTTVTYNDVRRFGFMDLTHTDSIEECRHFAGMGPEPLGNHFNPESLSEALYGKSAPIKNALLDQRVVAGVGNIYACEALFRARVSPRRKAASVAGKRAERLYRAVVEVLQAAIDAGGSSLRDFANAEGDLGYFQHRFDVYGREGEECSACGSQIERIVQAGRSTFFCSKCQR